MKLASAFLETVGIVTLTAGLWMLAPWVGLVGGGLALMAVGYAIGPAGER